MWLKTPIDAMGDLPEIQFQKKNQETVQQIQKMRKTETERVKWKASTPQHNNAKKHQGYKTPDHAFADKETIDIDTRSIGEEISAIEASKV